MNKRIYITESQARKILEARKDGFRLDGLLNQTFAAKIRYCKEWLGQPIGNGSSRTVFQMDDYSVLKLAKNAKGITQNEDEYRVGTDNYLSIFPKILNGTDETNFSWIISEFVIPAKVKDFKEVLNMDFEDVKYFCLYVQLSSRGDYGKSYGKKIQEIYSKYEENEDATYLLNNLYELCYGYYYSIGDAMRIANWGMCMRDGYPEMVLLDSGLSNDTYEKYYRRHR